MHDLRPHLIPPESVPPFNNLLFPLSPGGPMHISVLRSSCFKQDQWFLFRENCKKNLRGPLKLNQERGCSKETRLKWFSSLVLPRLWQAHEFLRNKTVILLVTHRAHQGAKNTQGFHWRRNALIQEEGSSIQQVVLMDLKCWYSRKQLSGKQNRELWK